MTEGQQRRARVCCGFGARPAEARRDAGMSVSDLSWASGVTAATLIRFETVEGSAPRSPVTTARLADALGCDPGWLWDGRRA